MPNPTEVGECVCVAGWNDATCDLATACGAGETCDLTICTCVEAAACPSDSECTPSDASNCGTGSECVDCACQQIPPAGEDDPVDDCSGEGVPQPCFGDVDIINVAVSCDQGTTSVRVRVAGGNPVAEPTGFHSRTVRFSGASATDDVLLSAVASGGSYSCTLSSGGVAQQPLGAGDVCGITSDGMAWEFVLSPASAGAGLTDVEVDFDGLGPDSNFRQDLAGPFPTQCTN